MDQKKNIQDLEARLTAFDAEPQTDLREKIDVLNELAWALRRKNLTRAIHLGQEAYDLSTTGACAESPYLKGKAYSLRTLGTLKVGSKNYQVSLGQLLEALALCQHLNDPAPQPFILAIIGYIYGRLGNYPEAFAQLFQALDMSRSLGDRWSEAMAFQNLGVVYKFSDDQQQALENYQHAFQLYQELDEHAEEACILNNMAMIYSVIGDDDQALEHGLRALHISQICEIGKLVPYLLDTIGMIYRQKGDHGQACDYLHRAMEAARTIGDKHMESSASLNLATVYFHQQDLSALSYVQQALALAEELESKQAIFECHHLLADIYAQQGEYHTALQHYQQYHAIHHEVVNEEATQRAKTLQVIHETEGARKEAELTRRKNAELEQEITEHHRAEAEVRQRAEEMRVLAELGREISSTLDLSVVLKQIAIRARDLLQAMSIAILLRQSDRNTFRPTLVLGPDEEAIRAWIVTSGTGIAGHIAQTGVAEFVNDAIQDPRAAQIPNTPKDNDDARAMMCAPLIAQNEVFGLIVLWRNPTIKPFTEDELDFLRGISQHAATAIDNARLFEEARQAKEVALEAQQRAEAAQRASEMANQAKSTFLANMSHELRTPLNSILGFTQVMARSDALTPDHQEHVSIIRRSGEHLLTLINSVLDLSKIEAGQMTLHEKDVDLSHLLHELGNLFSLKARTKGLDLRIERSDDVPQYIRTDGVKLQQVLINLLSNAIKFTTQGRVMLRVNAKRPGQARIHTTTPLLLSFEVSDTGPGIAPEEVAHLFEAFSQTQTGREAQAGTGLGLTISRRFAQLMGGDITVQSQVGEGTVFRVVIPCEVVESLDTRPSALDTRVVAVAPHQPRYRLLIVDDSRENRHLLRTVLAPLGFDLREACNGHEALTLWEQWAPHLIWMDMRMPGMDGYDATQKIKASPKGRETVIIAVTASSFEEERAAVLAAGCDDFVRKPFREHDIFEMLHQHLGVQYIYETNNPVPAPSAMMWDVLTPETFAQLPDALYRDLQEAIEYVDFEMTMNVIGQIRPHNDAAATALTTLVEQFRFDTLQRLCQECSHRG